jgi:small subunit ribosomal protein S17
MNTPKNNQRVFRGTVESASMKKTIVVRVSAVRWHPKYHRQYRTSKKYLVHDEANASKVGDTVQFVETRPLSKRKRWTVVQNQPS